MRGYLKFDPYNTKKKRGVKLIDEMLLYLIWQLGVGLLVPIMRIMEHFLQKMLNIWSLTNGPQPFFCGQEIFRK